MDKRILLSLAALAFACTACSPTQYIISTREGQMLTSYGKPTLDEKTGMYVYKDAEGRKGTIRKEDVGQIMER
jgi:hypothetical protein